MQTSKKTRVRFAPSPTGFLHVGGLRTALYNYLFAKQTQGDFVLRIEDTDKKRFVEGAVEKLIDSLEKVGLDWNEGAIPNLKTQTPKSKVKKSNKYPGVFEVGEYGPYIQSERLEIYREYAHQLVKEGKAYYCFCEPERLEEARRKAQNEKRPPMYDRYCLENIDEEKINEYLKQKCSATVRLKIPRDKKVEFDDLIRGRLTIDAATLDDQVILKSDGYPTYHLANVVDDHLMEITHVIRAEEWLPSTPKHILLYQAFGWDIPKFAHLPLLLNPDRTKLSKRQGDVAVEDYLAKGYLPEALINFVALLGWNPGQGSTQEIFSLDELMGRFNLESVHKAGAVFDIKKLDWMNNHYIKRLPIEELFRKTVPFLEQKEFFQKADASRKTEEYVKKVLAVERDRLAKLSDAGENEKFFFQEISYDKNLLAWKDMGHEELEKSLLVSKSVLEKIPESGWSKDALEEGLLEAAGEKRGDLLWPLRVALTGERKSPSPFEVAWVLGRTETLKRIGSALRLLGA